MQCHFPVTWRSPAACGASQHFAPLECFFGIKEKGNIIFHLKQLPVITSSRYEDSGLALKLQHVEPGPYQAHLWPTLPLWFFFLHLWFGWERVTLGSSSAVTKAKPDGLKMGAAVSWTHKCKHDCKATSLPPGSVEEVEVMWSIKKSVLLKLGQYSTRQADLGPFGS